MQYEDPDSFSTDKYAEYLNANSIPNPNHESKTWNFGKEIWCNLEGRYTFIVADMSHIPDDLF